MGLFLLFNKFSSFSFKLQYFFTVSISFIITAKGLLGLFFLCLSKLIAFSFFPSQTKLKPPKPLIANILPFFKNSITLFNGLSHFISFPELFNIKTFGPQTGHAFGCA